MTDREAQLEGICGEILCYICKSLPLRIPLDNEDLILGYVSIEFYQHGIESTKVKITTMKIRASVCKICEKCHLSHRRGRITVICFNPRHKQRQG
ncbi:hypothetical protein ES319_D06G142900v1 [Gossypium barbadense]|uniref:Ribosomal protein n=3 Tax=Gossypium TaxID=3633 RepID=A0A5J5R1Y0_GOSBA|nr:hypothetical protein ES319_D06G142900v1 [Gossypium barbadense]TYG65035.1 hypothetical protein ES288_D06G152600v1 [Gossypium darwinii]TYH66966.1 hypothetical protein ES332_D06G155200v1 [Gossypium tomentosum]